jgi:predicted PurR-regulated permease PerM
MTQDSTTERLPRLAIVIFVACLVIVAFFLYRIFNPFFTVLLWASVLTVVFSPLFKWILALVRGRRSLASFITCILILILIVLPITAIGVLITQQSIALYQNLQGNVDALADATAKWQELQNRPAVQWLVQQAEKWFGAGSFDLHQYLREAASAVSRFLVDAGPSLLRNVGAWIFSFFLIFITMFFLLRDGPQLIETIKSVSPLPDAIEAELFQKFEDVSFATFVGSLLTAMAQGTAASLLFWALGLPMPLFWGAVVSFVALVPMVGAFLVWLPWSAYLLLAGQTTKGLLLLAIGGLVVSSIDNVLKPIIIKGRTDMHPILVFLSVLGGLQAFGFIGILLGPLMVALFIPLIEFYKMEFPDALRHKRPIGVQETGNEGKRTADRGQKSE